MAGRRTWWSILLLGVIVAALAGCSLLETAMGPGEDSVAGEPGFVVGLEDGDLWVAQDAYAGLKTRPQGVAEGPRFVPGQLIVKFRSGQYSDASVSSLATKYTLRTSGKNKSLRLALVTVPAGTSLEEMKARLAADPKVESVGLNEIYAFLDAREEPLRPQAYTNDEYFLFQWALYRAIGYSFIPSSALPTTAPGIAIVDSGVDYTHPDITATKVIKGPDYFDGDMDPMDVYGHGTHVAGIAAALTSNNLGVAGVSGKSKILAIRVGNSSIPAFAGAAGITYAADNTSVKVINCSWGGTWDNPFVRDAVNYAMVTKGKLVVAAAGNDDTAVQNFPASLPNVLSVGATNLVQSGCVKADFSNYAAPTDGVDIAAPGVGIYSTTPVAGSTLCEPSYDYLDGTSMASPLVAGAAALVWGKWPTMTAAQVAELLTTSAYAPIYKDSHKHAFDSAVGQLDLYGAFSSKMTLPEPTCAIMGQVIDAGVATDAEPYDGPNPGLAGATVKATKYGTTTYKTATTRADGSYTIADLAAGDYTLSVSKTGYCTTPGIAPVSVVAGWFKWNWLTTCFALPKAQASSTYTVVVQFNDWTHAFVDLDSHLWLPETLDDRKKYRVNWEDPGILNVHPYARLLYETSSGTDTATPEGVNPLVAETTVFKGFYAGTYRFAVCESTGLCRDTEWGDLNAIVRLYNGATFKQAVTPQVSVPGPEDWWPVFELTRPAGTVVEGFPTAPGGPFYIPSEYPMPF